MLKGMRINKIKLAGFKSFVDPTSLALPGNLTGVVGPNGCGKSNVIDGLIWVLGESSAKHLRGDSMTDVIFSGSSSRKPVGQATAEIIFDNSENKLAGQYASFSEISIKRTLGRDGISSYFLNGTRCRKKDITNVFLGTGVGPRGYSVIEQGTISRVIEAKPEELRAYLEEAAGISQYKERRRETETRIKRTEENIERLSDIRGELEKQLKHLKRQANAAERYKELKKDERKLNGLLIAFNWRKTKEDAAANLVRKEESETKLQKLIAAQREIEALQVALSEEHQEITANFNTFQAKFYSKTADISRIEQELKYSKEKKLTLEKSQIETNTKLVSLANVLADNEKHIIAATAALGELDPQLVQYKTASEKMKTVLKESEMSSTQWQAEWDNHIVIKNKLSEEVHSKKIRLEHLTDAIASRNERRQKITDELAIDDSKSLSVKADALRSHIARLGSEEKILIDKKNITAELLSGHRNKAETQLRQLHESELLGEKKRGELASEKALQERALGGDQSETADWLKQKGITDVSRLAENITIEKGWEIAVETALRVPLNALCGDNVVDDLFRPGDQVSINKATITILESDDKKHESPFSSFPLLADRVKGAFKVSPFLDGAYSADTKEEALRARKSLSPHEVIVTKDGCLFGRYWAQLPANNPDEIGILARERNIHDLENELADLGLITTNSKKELETTHADIEKITANEKMILISRNEVSQKLAQQAEQLQKIISELGIHDHKCNDLSQQLKDIDIKLKNDAASSEILSVDLSLALEQLNGKETETDRLTVAKTNIQQRVDDARKKWAELRDESHAKELAAQDLRAKLSNYKEGQKRNISAREQSKEELANIENSISQMHKPIKDMTDTLEKELFEKLNMDKELSALRINLDLCGEKNQKSAKARTDAEGLVGECKLSLENDRLEERTYAVKLNELSTRFEETGENIEEALSAIEEKLELHEITSDIESLNVRLVRLEPINLAAIDEFNELSERKEYLDAQDTDLTDSLTTLKSAIRKIDIETKTRFKDTYDKVNSKLQETFPVLFGGGQAYLEMTDNDLLETGVTVMAQPPGKRNTSIHLLSGGEKALTALTFIFSIFDLNPAPFCLLDEVDAPLDDVNVVRLIDMLKTMSKSVQFLFVTHNKITMEIAEQLIGVTMQEPGVSRLVSVDMAEAVELAEIA